MKRIWLLILMCACVVSAVAQSKEQKEKIDRMAAQLEELKTETTLLQRQVQSMQETFNKTSGELNTLIVQMSDNISAIRRAQSSVSTSSNDAAAQLTTMGERVSATNQRMERLSEQFAQLRKLIEDLPKQPAIAQITPGNAEQLFAAAYADFSRGNYDLALSEFGQYVEIYPASELADNAQYFIGEIHYTKKQFVEAVGAFEKVIAINAKGDKAGLALFRRAMTLMDLDRKPEGIAQLQAIIKDYPRTREAEMATQTLQQIAPEALTPAPEAEKPAARKPRRP